MNYDAENSHMYRYSQNKDADQVLSKSDTFIFYGHNQKTKMII